MRALFALLLLPLAARAEPPALFDAGRTWIYDVTTTTYDIANWGSLTRPPKLTRHTVVTCTSSGDAITCDGPLEPPVAGHYANTAEGLERDRALILASRPKATRRIAHDDAMHADRISGVRPGRGGWCVFDDSSDVDPDGASTEQCFGPTGIQSGEFDGGGGDWRHVSYRLRTTRSARAAGTP